MLEYFDIEKIFFTIIGYPMSYVEFFGTIMGLVCVWLAAKSNILTWPTGIVNVICFFIIFYQINLYSDMFLQVYFLGMSIYGWIYWKKNDPDEKLVTELTPRYRMLGIISMVFFILILGYFMSGIHEVFPDYFKEPAAYPYPDAFTTVLSIYASYLMVKKKWESWVLWIIVDVVCVFLYYLKGMKFISLEYFIFLGIASYGLYKWLELKKENQNALA